MSHANDGRKSASKPAVAIASRLFIRLRSRWVVHVVPTDGVLDLNVLRFEHGWAGSIIGGMGVLSSQSTTQQIDLCSLYRLEKAGHYSVYITSNEVSRIKTAEEGGGLEHLTLESN